MPIAGQNERRASHRFGGVLWQRNFRLLWNGESISAIGNAMAVVGVPLLAVTVLHASTFAVAALTAAAYLPWLAIGLPVGAWVDRLPRLPLMIVCDVISALLYASLPVAAWLHVLTIGQVIAVALLAGAVNVFFATAYQVYLPSLVTAADLIEGNAKLQGSAEVALICGRGAAGLAAQAVGEPPRCYSTRPASWSRQHACCRIRTKRHPGSQPAAPRPCGRRSLRASGSSPVIPTCARSPSTQQPPTSPTAAAPPWSSSS